MYLANYLGVIANALAIIFGGLLGTLLGRRFTAPLQEITLQALGLVTLLIGFQMATQGQNILIMTLSLVLGGLAGELLGIQNRLNAWEKKMESRVKGGERMGKALIFASLLYGIGPMAIMGSLESGLYGTHSILTTKALLDGTAAIPFAAAMGWGICLSAIPVFLYQGAIVFFALIISPFLTPEMAVEISGVGGLLILAIGLNVLKVTRIPVAGLLPAIPINICLLFLL
ncbi:MAG: DUF554 domain-containing protein [Bacillota bacterium]